MHKNSEAKQPKETDEIKKKLESYAALHRRIDNQIERLENLEAVMGSISSPSFDGISGGGGDGTSKQERQVIQKVTLEETIRRMITDEDRERSELEALISEMEKPDEQTVLEMHYFDAANWWTVCAALHGSREDYDEHEQRYLKRTFAYLIPAVFAEMASATGFYYTKAKAENKIKLMNANGVQPEADNFNDF